MATAARIASQLLGSVFAIAAALALGGIVVAVVTALLGGEVQARDVVRSGLVSCVLAGNAYLFLVYLPMRRRPS